MVLLMQVVLGKSGFLVACGHMCDGALIGIDCLLSLATGSKLFTLAFMALDGLWKQCWPCPQWSWKRCWLGYFGVICVHSSVGMANC